MATEEFIDEYEEAECPTCGAVVPIDATECTECGQRFEEDEEELWEEDEEEEEFLEDEEVDDWEGYWEETSASKMKLYLGIVILFSGTIVAFLSWFHNQIQWNPLGLENYAPNVYGPYDQMTGGTGSITTIIGIVLIFLYLREVKAHHDSRGIPDEVMLSETDYFSEEPKTDYDDNGFEELPEEEIAEIECPECGEVNSVTATECWNCGFLFEEVEMEEPEEEDLDEEDEEEPDEIRCPNCGTKNEPGAEFCANCEQDLSGSTEIWGEAEEDDLEDDFEDDLEEDDLEDDFEEEDPEAESTEYVEEEEEDPEAESTEYVEDEEEDLEEDEEI